MKTEKYEYCCICGNATGRAGDDSIYLNDGTGPLCEDCYEVTKDNEN